MHLCIKPIAIQSHEACREELEQLEQDEQQVVLDKDIVNIYTQLDSCWRSHTSSSCASLVAWIYIGPMLKFVFQQCLDFEGHITMSKYLLHYPCRWPLLACNNLGSLRRKLYGRRSCGRSLAHRCSIPTLWVWCRGCLHNLTNLESGWRWPSHPEFLQNHSCKIDCIHHGRLCTKLNQIKWFLWVWYLEQ